MLRETRKKAKNSTHGEHFFVVSRVILVVFRDFPPKYSRFPFGDTENYTIFAPSKKTRKLKKKGYKIMKKMKTFMMLAAIAAASLTFTSCDDDDYYYDDPYGWYDDYNHGGWGWNDHDWNQGGQGSQQDNLCSSLYLVDYLAPYA